MSEQDLEYEQNILTLVDEEGEEHEFEIVDTLDENEESYIALVPVFDDPDDVLEDSGELVVLKVATDDGEEFLEAIEDEAEFDRISAIFMERLKDTFDFEEEEE